jgi:hypothetical protein
MAASRTAGERKKAVMNLPEPSGSSPPEKPPGRKMIWHHYYLRLGPGLLKGTGGVVFAVCAGKNGYEHPGPHDHGRGRGSGLGLPGKGGNILPGHVGSVRKNALQPALVDGEKLVQPHALAAPGYLSLSGGAAQGKARLAVPVQLRHEGAVVIAENVLVANSAVEIKAQHVAEAHFHHALGGSAVARGAHGYGSAASYESGYQLEILFEALAGGQAIRAVFRLQKRHPMSRSLELVGYDVRRPGRGDGEGHQRGRHGHILEGAGHGILAADGGDPSASWASSAPSRAERACPSGRVLSRSFSKYS